MDEREAGQASSEATREPPEGAPMAESDAAESSQGLGERRKSARQVMLEYEASRGGPTMVSDNGMLVAKPGCAMFVPGTALGKLSLLGGTEYISGRPGAYAEQYISTYEAYYEREPPSEEETKLYNALIEIYRPEPSEDEVGEK